VNEKIEGFYDVCKSRRLSGSQGVIIPHQNVQDLLLRPDVIEAVKAGTFHIWPVATISEGIEILTGQPGGQRLLKGGFTRGSVLWQADEKLREMARTLDRFGRSEDDNGDADAGDKKGKKGARRR